MTTHRALLSLALLLIAVSGVTAALFSKNGPVVQLTAANFKREVLDIEKPTMVSFTAPWCGHCQRLVPEYEKAAKQLSGVVKLANIDCDEEPNKPICGRYGVQGFPTLKLFPATKKRLPRDYQGPRTARDIAAYTVDALPMGAKKVTPEQLHEYLKNDEEKPKVLLFSTKTKSSPLYKSLALDFRTSISFAFMRGDQASVRAAARAHIGLEVKESDLPVLVVVPSRAAGSEVEKNTYKKYNGKLNYHELRDWIVDNVPEASKKASTKKAAPKKPAPAKKKPTPKAKAKKEKEIPEGAQVEWKIENEEDSPERKAKLEEIAAMLNAAAEKRAQAAKKAGDVYDDVKQKANDVKDAYNEVKDKIKEKVSISSSSESSSSSTLSDGDSHEEREAEYSTSSSVDGEEPVKSSFKVHSSKGASLRESLAQWLDGEQVDWQGEYKDQFEQAHKAAAELIAKDPAKAQQIAAQGEEWLLDHLYVDLHMMRAARADGVEDDSITDEKIAKVQQMYDELEKRTKERKSEISHDEL